MRSILEEVTGIDTILKNKFSFLSSEKMWGGDTLRRAVINCMHLLMDVFLISPSRLQSQKAKYSWPGAVLASNFIGGVRIGEYFNASYMKKMGLGALGMFASYGSVVSTVALATSVTGITNLSTFSTMGLMLQSSALYIKDPKLQALLTAGNIGFQFLGPLTTIYQAVDSATGLGSILALSTLTGGGLLYLHAKHPEILKSLGERSDDFNPMDWYTAEDFSKQKGSIEKNDFNPDNLAENNYRFKQKAFNLIQEAMNAIELNAEKQQTLLSELEELKKEGERLKWLEGSPQPKAKNTESKYHARRVENLQAIQKKESEIQELVTQSNALYENYNKIIAENPILSLEVAKLEVMRLKILQEAINQEMTALEEKNKSIASSKKNQTSALSWLNQLLEKQREVLPQNSKNDKKLQEAFKRTHGERIHKELQQIQSNTQEMFQQFWQFAETLDEATQEDLKKEWTDHFKSPLGLSYGNLLNKTEQHQFENIHKQQIFLQKHLDQVIKKVQGSLDDQVKTAEKDVNIKAEAEAAQFRKALEERIENTRIPDIVLGTPEETINTRDATSPEDAVNPPNTEAIEAQFQATHQEFVTETLETIVTAVQGIQDGYASDKDIREKLSNLHEGLQAQLQAAEVAEEQRQVELGDVGDQEDPIAQLRNKHREAMQKTLSEIQDINVTRLNPLGKGSRLTIEAIKERNERGQEIIVGEKIHAGHYIPVSIKEEDAPSLLKAAPESHENEINQESLSATEEQSERSADLEEHGADNSLNNLQEILKNLMAAKPVVKRLDSQEEIDPITLPALKEKLTAFAADTNRQEGFNDDIFLHEKVFIQDKSLKKMEERWREEPENSLRLEEYSIENRFNNLKAIFNDNEKLTNFASNLFSPKSMEAYEGALQGIIAPRVDSDQLIVVNDAEGSTRKLKIDLKPEYQFKILPPEEGLNFMQVSIEGTYKALGEWQVEKDEIVDYSLEKQENSFVRTHVLVKIAYQEPEAKKGWFSWWKASDNLTFTPSLSYAGIIAKVSEEIQAPQADLSAL